MNESITVVTDKSDVTAVPWRDLLLVTLLTSIWVHASEVFRYFVFVMPAMRESLAVVEGVAPMSLGIFMLWGIWDTLLTALVVWMCWLNGQCFGYGRQSVVLAASVSWCFLFVLFWFAMVNMALAEPALLLITLPLSGLEMWMAAVLATHLLRRRQSVGC